MKMNKRVIVLNAPPSAGKDEIANELCDGVLVHHKEFKKTLFDIAKAVAQISDDEWDRLYHRDFKEIPTDRLFGRSPRDHMIHTSEELVKPVYGKDYFGNALAISLQDGVNIVSDGGFMEELRPVIDSVGADNVLVLRFHRDGCTFDGDSRDWLTNTGCVEIDIHNVGTLQDLFKCVKIAVSDTWG